MLETKESIDKVIECKGPWGRVVPDVRENFAWDFEEATAINIVRNHNNYLDELKIFVSNYFEDKKILEELIKYQDITIVNPNRTYPLKEKFSYNFNEVINLSAKLKNKENSLVIEAKNYKEDIFEWGKETLWWGRRVAANKAKITKSENIDVTKIQESIPNIFDKR